MTIMSVFKNFFQNKEHHGQKQVKNKIKLLINVSKQLMLVPKLTSIKITIATRVFQIKVFLIIKTQSVLC